MMSVRLSGYGLVSRQSLYCLFRTNLRYRQRYLLSLHFTSITDLMPLLDSLGGVSCVPSEDKAIMKISLALAYSCEKISVGLSNLDFTGKQELLRLLVEKVSCDGQGVEILTIIPLGEQLHPIHRREIKGEGCLPQNIVAERAGFEAQSENCLPELKC